MILISIHLVSMFFSRELVFIQEIGLHTFDYISNEIRTVTMKLYEYLLVELNNFEILFNI